MTDTSAPASFDIEEQRIRINRSIAETEKFVAEQHKLLAEAYKLDRDTQLAPIILTASAMTAGAALFGAGAAFFKVFGH